MPRSLLAASLLIIAAPLAILGWTSVRSLQSESIAARQQIDSLFQQRLRESQQPLVALFDEYQRHLADRFSGDVVERLQSLRTLERTDPIVRSCLLVQRNGQMSHPSVPLTQQPKDLNHYAALASLAASHPAFSSEVDASASKSQSVGVSSASAGKPIWQSWYMNQGMQLVLWFPQSDGSVAGVLLERSRWIADMIAILPPSQGSIAISKNDTRLTGGYSTLVDEQQQVVYRWGESMAAEMEPISEIHALAPIANWRFRYHGNLSALLLNHASSAILWSSIATSTVLLSLAAYVLTAMRRQMRLAQDQVSFAGHVSHELRTPLTNIRLYADLAAQDLAGLGDPSLQRSIASRLDVISQESERLSGLVSGVLDFMRGDHRSQPIHRSAVVPDELLDEIIESFAPSFNAAGILVTRERGAGHVVRIDGDILRIVMVNLLGNVEKYAACGGRVMIQSAMAQDKLAVRIRDYGPGVAPRHRGYVFKPFTRLNHAIEAPSGTGIGLSIALAAAKRHGGNLVIESCPAPGTCFLLTLAVTE